MKKLVLISAVCGLFLAVFAASRPAEAAAPYPTDIHGAVLRDGDVISANVSAGDPDIFIIKFKSFYGPSDPGAIPDSYNGHKRLFLNPAIFNMYGHLGGFARVRQVTAAVRDSFVTSGLFRNCETGDQRVWATEVTSEDYGILHHVQMSGYQATSEDPRFFDRVFCINTREDNFYAKSINPYYRLADIPVYFRRTCQVRPGCLDTVPQCYLAEPIEGWCPITPYPTPPPGCYYQQVQCITAPCNPQLICPSPYPCEPLPACARPGANPQCALAPNDPNGRPWCEPTPTPVSGSCYVGGCSGQLCTDQPGAASTCEYRAEYACYQYSRCERQSTGMCGWTPTSQFNQCWANTTSGY